MAYVSVYRDANYGGPFMRLGQGFFSGEKLVGHTYVGAVPTINGEQLDKQISSIRVPSFFVVSIHSSYSISGDSRVIIGPREIPDLAVIGMNDRISSILVAPFQGIDSLYYNAGGKAVNSSVVVASDFGVTGMTANIPIGDFDATRLANEGMSLNGNTRSARIPAGVLAVFYSGSNFNEDQNAVVSVGPTRIDEFSSVGLATVGSIRVMVSNQSALSTSTFPASSADGLPVYNMVPGFNVDEIRRRLDERDARVLDTIGRPRYPNSTLPKSTPPKPIPSKSTPQKPQPAEAPESEKKDEKAIYFLGGALLAGLGLTSMAYLSK